MSNLTAATLSGGYRIELTCTGAEAIVLSVHVNAEIIKTLTLPCQDKVARQIEVAPAVTGNVELDVADSRATGRALLYRD